MPRTKYGFALALLCWLISSAAFVVPSAAQEASEPIVWQQDFRSASKLAAREKRPLLVFVTASWCSFCDKMDRETWADDEVVQAVRKHFVPVRLDADRNQSVVRRLRITALPTSLAIDAQGNILSRSEGLVRPEAMAELLERAVAKRPQTEDEQTDD